MCKRFLYKFKEKTRSLMNSIVHTTITQIKSVSTTNFQHSFQKKRKKKRSISVNFVSTIMHPPLHLSPDSELFPKNFSRNEFQPKINRTRVFPRGLKGSTRRQPSASIAIHARDPFVSTQKTPSTTVTRGPRAGEEIVTPFFLLFSFFSFFSFPDPCETFDFPNPSRCTLLFLFSSLQPLHCPNRGKSAGTLATARKSLTSNLVGTHAGKKRIPANVKTRHTRAIMYSFLRAWLHVLEQASEGRKKTARKKKQTRPEK